MTKKNISFQEVLHNAIVGLTVSFVALSLGAAFGILSGRGAFAGMISAGIIAAITGLLGGTRVQCSGPTAPMSSVTAVVVAATHDQIVTQFPHLDPNQFTNLVILLTGIILGIMALLRLGRYISLIPNVVISGFMNGIALMIWVDQIKKIFGLGGKDPFGGPMTINLLTAAGTVALIFVFPPLIKKINPELNKYLPSTLLSLIFMTVTINLLKVEISCISLSGQLLSFGDLVDLIKSQIPTNWSSPILKTAFPFALQLAMLCYLDTLLTSLVIDKMTGEKTKQNQELFAQGVANSTVAFVGGIPGAQATIRSVLVIKEKGSLRIVGVFIGLFVLIEMILLQDVLEKIPEAVFAGILFKVGYDVFDFRPVRLYFRELFTGKFTLIENILTQHEDEPIFVTNLEILMIAGTTFVTLVYDLNAAAIGFTLLFYAINKLIIPNKPMRDLRPIDETTVFREED